MDSYPHASSVGPARPVLLAGFGDLAQRVARLLQQQGQPSLGLRRQPISEHPATACVRADLTVPASLRRLPAGLDTVLYAPTPDARDASRYRAVFVDGLGHLLDQLQPERLRRVVLVSSSAVYGEHGGAWVDETTAPAPLAFNGEILLEAEQLLARRCPQAGVVLRLAGIYGPGRWQWLQRLRQGQITVPRQVPHWSNRIHIDDAAQAVLQLLQAPQPERCYIGVDDVPQRLDQFYDALADQLGLPRPGAGPAPASVGSKRLSNQRLRQLGWAPRWPNALSACLGMVAEAPPAV